jgi:hypothetical protein
MENKDLFIKFESAPGGCCSRRRVKGGEIILAIKAMYLIAALFGEKNTPNYRTQTFV